MCAVLAFIAALIGAGLLARGVIDAGFGFLAIAAALAAWRATATPLRKIEIVVALGLTLTGATQGHAGDGGGAALVVILLIETARLIQ